MRKRLFLVLAALVLCALLAGCIQQAPGAESDRGNITESPAQNTTLLPEENINAAHNNTVQENKSLNAMAGFTIKNERTGKSYSGRYIINESGMYIYFDDPLPKFSGAIPTEEYEAYLYSGNRTEANHLTIRILNKTYAISCLDYNTKSRNSRVCLAEEKTYAVLGVFGCSKLPSYGPGTHQYVNTSDGKYAFAGYGYRLDNYDYIAMCKPLSDDACGYEYKHRVGANSYLPGGDILHVWDYTLGRTPCLSTAMVSVFKDEIVLENTGLVTLEWDAATKNQRLKSITILAGSGAYKKLVGSQIAI